MEDVLLREVTDEKPCIDLKIWILSSTARPGKVVDDILTANLMVRSEDCEMLDDCEGEKSDVSCWRTFVSDCLQESGVVFLTGE